MQILRELHDGVDPLAKSSHTLHAVKDDAVAEDQFVRLWVWSEISSGKPFEMKEQQFFYAEYRGTEFRTELNSFPLLFLAAIKSRFLTACYLF